MKINFNSLNFCEHQRNYQIGENLIKDYFDDNNRIIRQEKYDTLGRNICTNWFDKNGSIIEFMKKDYFKSETEDGFIETYKSKTQEYIRKSYTKIENNLKHHIDDYKSRTGKSYYNDFVHDIFGNLIKIITNGKVIELKK